MISNQRRFVTAARLSLGVALALTSLASARAATSHGPATSFLISDASGVTLTGSSNLARWQCKGTSILGRVEVNAGTDEINAVLDRLQKEHAASWSVDRGADPWTGARVELRIPVVTLKCGNAKMEKDMARALKAAVHPNIEFRFRDLRGAIVRDVARDRYRATVIGEITLAGASRTLDIVLEAERVGPNRFRLRSSIPVLMTDFGITPPTGLFGLIKARNQLVVGFDMVVKAAAEPIGKSVSTETQRP